MRHKPWLDSPLQSKLVALPESRQLDVLAGLFERRRARVLRIPLVAIRDAPDQDSVNRWIKDFIINPPDYLIILTGEGLRRLIRAARRLELESQFVGTLGRVKKICRGPKPVQSLREVKLDAWIRAVVPTTAGVIDSLRGINLRNSRVSVQLYGEDPNNQLMDYLRSCQLDACCTVAPYVYLPASENEEVKNFIQKLASRRIDLIVFTSKPQVLRLFEVAELFDLMSLLSRGLRETHIAAVGPVVREALQQKGCNVNIMPKSAYFMKPLLRATEVYFDSITDGG